MKKNSSILAVLLAFALALGGCSAAPASSASKVAATSAVEYPAATSAAAATSAVEYPAASESNEDAPSYDFNLDGSANESYLPIEENAAKSTDEESMLTFSLKVDTASYTNVQRYIENGERPPHDAVRTEEMINYFNYDELILASDGPFGIYAEVAPSPFDSDKWMAFVRVKSKDVDREQLPASNLTFLIDTSGSMFSYDKLPLLKEAFALLVETLGEKDRVSIATYAGSSAVLLEGASGADKATILKVIDGLEAAGSTAGADGIRTAYKLAEQNFIQGGNNRVILASDGDFNVGISSVAELEKFISGKRDTGVYLSVLGFGTGNIRDDIMETLAKDGNGNYSYINSVRTAEKVLVNEMASNLFTVADDVKAQVEFNPQNVKSYRLIGYENRRLSNKDFNDDTKDSGEIGIGTDVVILFELELQNGGSGGTKYSSAAPRPVDGEYGDELFEVRVRYKNPGESQSNLITRPVAFTDLASAGSSDFQFACSVAAFGDLLRESKYAGSADAQSVAAVAKNNLGRDAGGYRLEFVSLLAKYSDLR